MAQTGKDQEQAVAIRTDGATAQIFIEGKELKWVSGYSISHFRNQVPVLEVSYDCYEQLTIDGNMVVKHNCGLR